MFIFLYVYKLEVDALGVITVVDSRAGRGIPKMPKTNRSRRRSWMSAKIGSQRKQSPEDNTGGRTNTFASRYNHNPLGLTKYRKGGETTTTTRQYCGWGLGVRVKGALCA